jgi:HAE1 family hydrophobic/amphiphilic exporter-1
MAVALIYLVMCALFESFILPFSIMTTVPLALIGAVWMLYLTGVPFDSISLIGCILMAGIIVNNGIVIVDHMRNLCMHAPDRNAAILQAGKDRFRPVLMTAITTILGLVPVAMAQTGGAATFAGLGRSLIGGLITGTALTLFVVPVFFGLLDDFSCWSRNFLANITTRNR